MNFSEDLPEGIDFLLYPSALGLLTERANGSVTAISKPFGASPLIMLSKTPLSISVTSFQIDFADKWTWLGILLSVITVSFLLSISEILYNSDSNKIVTTKKCLELYFKYTWNSAMTFFCEPFGTITKRGSQRIICGIWFLACVVIVNELTGAMKSKYSFVEYKYIKDIGEITPRSPWQPRCVDGQSEDRLLQLMASKETKFKYIVNNLKRFDQSIMATSQFYLEIEEDDVLFFSKYVLYFTIGACVEERLLEKDELPQLYVSKPISEMYLVYPLSYEMSKNKKLKKHIDFITLTVLENKWMYFYDAHYQFHLDSITWHPQSTETNSITLEDITPVFKLFLHGQLISALLLIFEFVISYFKTKKLQF